MKYKMISAVMALVLITAIVGTASAITPDYPNKSYTNKNALWIKHTGSANAPVCGLKLCKNNSPHKLPDGIYPLKAPWKKQP